MPSALVNAIIEIQANGLATRGNLDAGRLLAICQRCTQWAFCSRNPGELAEKLCDAGYWCGEWDAAASKSGQVSA